MIGKNFQKEKEYLICVDSDGCAMDTMDMKHQLCFGPCMIEEWELDKWKEEILSRWNEINLYTITRGINRFKGLLIILKETQIKYKPIEGLQQYEVWVNETKELSNHALENSLNSICMEKALSWSKKVNEEIAAIPDDKKKPFKGVKQALSLAHRFADIAVVSSANLQAVIEEWDLCELLPYTDIIMAQDFGSKAHCIAELLKEGYDKKQVLMIGDAEGDYRAAKENGVWFYPILVKNEKKSWQEFESMFHTFIRGKFDEQCQNIYDEMFYHNLEK